MTKRKLFVDSLVYQKKIMKQCLLMVLLVAIGTVTLGQVPHADTLLAYKHYFELRNLLQSRSDSLLPHKKLYYQAHLDNFFNRLNESNEHIAVLLKQYRNQLSAKEASKLLEKKIDNHVKLYQYKEAWKTSEALLKQYRQSLSEETIKDVKNSAIIWKGLQRTPAQTTLRESDTKIAFTRDKANLINIPVRFGDSTFSFIFDTGANLSVVSETYAARANLRLLNVRYMVRAITGMEVQANLAVADELSIGNIRVRNVVFIVFPDSTLSFGGGVYKIDGIIGFPVIEQLGEIHITQDGHFFIPQQPASDTIRNLGIEGLTPVACVYVNGHPLAFTFDTGAMSTFFYATYYEKFKAHIDSTGTPGEMRYGGAGGTVTTKVYNLKNVRFDIAGKTTTVEDISVKTTPGRDQEKYYYGNLGQDVMSGFREMVINFRDMYLKFE